jgi:aldose 1-epimerase
MVKGYHPIPTSEVTMAIPPSGEQFTIAHGSMQATAVQVGGGLRTFSAGDLEVLDGFPEDEMDRDGRGNLLIPWPNRLAGGTYSFDGQSYQLPLTEPSQGNAIHGLVRWANWTVEERHDERITLVHRLYPSTGFPFILDLSATYALSDDGLHTTLRATNIGAKPCPFGAGQHPYLRVGTPLVNDALLQVPAGAIYRYNQHLIPTERVPVDGSPLDFRTKRQIGTTEINMDYTHFDRDADGIARVTVEAPDGGPSLQLWMDRAFRHATVYTGETVQPPTRRRHSIAVEPMSCPPNAFNSGEDLITLQPGESWEGNWGITVHV